MKKITIVTLFLLIFISGCQKKSDPTKPSLTTLDSSASLYEDGSQYINLTKLTFLKGSSESLVYTILTLPEHGNVQITNEPSSDDIAALYHPNTDYYGIDSFTYQVSNGELTSTGTITLRVTANNDGPQTKAAHLMTYENTAISFDLSTLVRDVDSTDFIYVIELLPVNGLIELNGSTMTYTPNINFIGKDSFRYLVFDENNVSSSLISIEVISKS